jgi:DNA end-binding protein Ku
MKTSIAFGLIYIPVKLEKCVKPSGISFHQIDKKTMSRISYIKSCRECDGKGVPLSDIVKGYEYEKNRHVIFEAEDFEKVKTKKDKNITIERFVHLDEIDPVFFNEAYYVTPTGGERAYSLLLSVLESEKMVGIARSVLNTKEVLIALRAKNGGLIINTMHFDSDIRKNPAKETTTKPSEPLKENEIQMAKMLVENMASPFNPADYKDEYTERVMQAIEAKIDGKEIEITDIPEEKITNLMEALQRSISATANSAQ